MAKNKKKQDAMVRARELFETPTNQLPKLAFAYMKAMCARYGGCSEVALTALAHYVQFEEGLHCSDPLYRPSKENRKMYAMVKRL